MVISLLASGNLPSLDKKLYGLNRLYVIPNDIRDTQIINQVSDMPTLTRSTFFCTTWSSVRCVSTRSQVGQLQLRRFFQPISKDLSLLIPGTFDDKHRCVVEELFY